MLTRQSVIRLRKVLIGLTPFGALVAFIVAYFPQLIIGSTKGYVATSGFRILFRVTLVEGGLLLLFSWIFYITKQNSRKLESGHGATRFSLIEVPFMVLALVGFLLSNGYARPIVFFVSMFVLYMLLLVELTQSNPTVSSFLVKLIVIQLVFVESFSQLYPGFVGPDSSRDFYIAKSIIANAGGLPKEFVDVIWYDTTPMAPLLYAEGTLFSNLPLRVSELLLGFCFTFVTTLATGALALRVTGDRKTSLLVMWLASLVPLIWVWSTWPIPEMFAASLIFLSFLILFRDNTAATTLVFTLLAILIVLTHGGAALGFIGVLVVLAVVTRNKLAIRMSIITSTLFTSFTVYDTLSGVTSGFETVKDFLVYLFSTGVTFTSGPSVSYSGVWGVPEAISYGYWLVFLIVLAWLGLFEILRRSLRLNRLVVSLLLISLASVLFGFGFGTVFGTRVDITRYVGLFGYPMVCVAASMGFFALGRTAPRKAYALIIVSIFVFAGVSNPRVSPDFWQGFGQSNFASANRIQYSTTYPEMDSQLFINAYDQQYFVVYNYLPEFVNLTRPDSVILIPWSLSIHPQHYWIGVSPFDVIPNPPYIALFSSRASVDQFLSYSLPSNFSIEDHDMVFSSLGSSVDFVT
jgi:hypothetical protein